jgi:anti-sigma factor RsiW
LKQVRAALRRELAYRNVPVALQARIAQALNRLSIEFTPVNRRNLKDRQPWPLWRGAFAGIGSAAVAASLALIAVSQPSTISLSDELLSAHVRSLMPEHLIDVVSTHTHTVKPWFSGRADVSPAVADFAAQGYELIGGRADYLDHQRATVVIYLRNSHVINVFSWNRSWRSLPMSTTLDGYHLAFWASGDLAYCAVSDIDWGELLALAKLMQDSI